MVSRAIIIVMATGLLGCLCPAASPATASAPANGVSAVVEGGNAFAADLYAKLAAEHKGNLFFSPGSIHIDMAMAYAGAAGDTADQMAKTLHYALPADKLNAACALLLRRLDSPGKKSMFDESHKEVAVPAYQLIVANALWAQKDYGFKPEFIKQLPKGFGAAVYEVDFGQAEKARKTINDWIAKETRERIKDLIAKGQLNDQTRLVLTNAVYFKSKWQEPFLKDATKDGPFKLSAEKSVDVPMMRQEGKFDYLAAEDFRMLELPYLLGELSMVIILPKKVDGLGEVEKSLTAGNMAKWFKQTKSTLADVSIPKFKFSSDFLLAEVLKKMGMTDAFDSRKADFSGMTEKERLFLSQVIHKAFVAVDEEGTEAAAATAIPAEGEDMEFPPKKPVVFKADHPFVLMIRHNTTGEILFMGRLVNPKGGEAASKPTGPGSSNELREIAPRQ